MLTATQPRPSSTLCLCRAGTTGPGGPGRGGGSWPCGPGGPPGPAGINIVYTEPLHQLVLDITADKMKVSNSQLETDNTSKTPSDLEVQFAPRQALYSDD